jgi:hypothetical protein
VWDDLQEYQRREAPRECQWQGATVKLTRTYSQRLSGGFPPLALYLTDLGNAIALCPSEGTGRGSEFIVRLPRTHLVPAIADLAPPEQLEEKLPPHHILVVDDNLRVPSQYRPHFFQKDPFAKMLCPPLTSATHFQSTLGRERLHR